MGTVQSSRDRNGCGVKAFAIIPARGGSKGIPGKNLQQVGGVPLIARTVRAALLARSVSHVYVSTDSHEIATCAEQAGASIIQRPDSISGDTASSEDALLHACEVWNQAGSLPDALVFLQTTSPFTTSADIDGAVAKLDSEPADVVLGVAAHHRFQWCQNEDGCLSAVGHDMFSRPRRQELSNRFVETGALYVMRTPGFVKSRFRFFGKVVGHELPEESMLEIDTPQDLLVARAIADSRTLSHSPQLARHDAHDECQALGVAQKRRAQVQAGVVQGVQAERGHEAAQAASIGFKASVHREGVQAPGVLQKKVQAV